MSARIVPLLAVAVIALAGCSDGSEDEELIEETVYELVDAMNSRDEIAAASLFTSGTIEPVNAAGDSSVVYRLLTIPGGEDFKARSLSTTVLDRRAQSQFDLEADVSRGGSTVGTMTMRVGLELERVGQVWRILPGSDRIMWEKAN